MPEFKVDCAMCGHNTFSATVDTLGEALTLVRAHIDYMKEPRSTDLEYLKKHPNPHLEYLEKPEHKNEKLPVTNPEILASNMFSWEIHRLKPFNAVFEIFNIKPIPPILTLTAQ